MSQDYALRVAGLKTSFMTHAGIVRAVDGVSLCVAPGETVAIVGESGSGKSVTALSIMGLIRRPQGTVEGQIVLNGTNLLSLSERQMRTFRGKAISMVFQEPMTSLNPVLSVGAQISEAILAHEAVGRKAAWDRAIDLLDLVRIPEPQRTVREFPHRLSGGMRQRVMIAMAIACKPVILIADEPTTALDVTIQAQILDLLDGLRRDLGMGLLLITHDLGVVSQMANRVIVMYAGRKVEEAATEEFFLRPRHPYSRGLLSASPRMDTVGNYQRGPLYEIPGMVPSLLDLPPGCPFADRCTYVMDVCRQRMPAPTPTNSNGEVRCFAVQGTGHSATEPVAR